MQAIRKLTELGYPKLFFIETRTPAGLAACFELTASKDRLLRISRRISPDIFTRLRDLSRRCDMCLEMRFGVSPTKDEVRLYYNGQIHADDCDLLKRLRAAVEQDIASIFLAANECDSPPDSGLVYISDGLCPPDIGGDDERAQALRH